MSKDQAKSRAGESTNAHFGNRLIKLFFKQAKTGGANGAGEHGGVYDYTDDDGLLRRILVKNDPKVHKDMAEYLTAKIFERTAPESGAQIALVKIDDKPYIGSKFFRDYDPGEITEKIKTPLMPTVHGRVAAVGTLNKITGFFRRHMLGKDGTPRYADFEKTMVTSLLVGDFDVHTSNVGILKSKDQNGRQKLVRIDYGGAFMKLEPEIHPNSRSRHKFGQGPTNHFREYPRSMRTSPEFAAHAFEVANMDLNGKIDEAFEGLKGHYGIGAFRDFAKSLGVPENELPSVKGDLDKYADAVKTKVQEVLKDRQQSLRKYACEISIDNCFDKNGEFKDFIKLNGKEIPARTYLASLIKDPENKEYFDKLVQGGEKELHFRTREHKRFNWLHMSLFSDGLTKSQEKNLRSKVFEQIKGMHELAALNRRQPQTEASITSPSSVDISIPESPAHKIQESLRSRASSAEDPRPPSPARSSEIDQDPVAPSDARRASVRKASFVERVLERMSSTKKKSFEPMEIGSNKQKRVEVTDQIRMR